MLHTSQGNCRSLARVSLFRSLVSSFSRLRIIFPGVSLRRRSPLCYCVQTKFMRQKGRSCAQIPLLFSYARGQTPLSEITDLSQQLKYSSVSYFMHNALFRLTLCFLKNLKHFEDDNLYALVILYARRKSCHPLLLKYYINPEHLINGSISTLSDFTNTKFLRFFSYQYF